MVIFVHSKKMFRVHSNRVKGALVLLALVER